MKNICPSILKISLFLLLIYSGCSSNTSYDSLARKSLDSSIKNDSLFLGYQFGMSAEEFQEISWEMNQEGIISGYTKIVYSFNDLKSKATMEFFPIFQDNKIVRIPVSIGYDGWSPWLDELHPEYLIIDLIDYYKKIYSSEFIEVFIPSINQNAFVAFSGNREIRLYQNSPNTVMVDFIDLSNL